MKKNVPASSSKAPKPSETKVWEVWQVLQYCIDLGKRHNVEPSELLDVYFDAYEEHRASAGSIVPLLWKEDTEAYWNGQAERQEYQLERVRQRAREGNGRIVYPPSGGLPMD